MNNSLCFISRNYKAQFSAAGKAKIDCEIALEEMGFKNIGLPRATTPNSVIGFLITLTSLVVGFIRMRKGSTICVQYPTKKYYDSMVFVAKLKGCKVITVIHDLRSQRKQKKSIQREIKSLNQNDVIISHNAKMSSWLRKNGLTTRTVDLDIFDYLGAKENFTACEGSPKDNYSLVFAGVLEKRKNGFIYALDEIKEKYFTFNLYGVGFSDKDVSKNSIIQYKGVFPADEIINRLEGQFGIVWDGTSVEECKGSFGEYLKVNNPHKTSMYLRAGLPIIIWDKAAIADFVCKNNVGITVSSLTEINERLQNLDDASYLSMRDNAMRMSKLLGDGHFMKKAISNALI